MKKFKVGQMVNVFGVRHCYSSYTDFFEENNLEEYLGRYSGMMGIGKYKIVAIGEHRRTKETIYVLEGGDRSIYLMDNGGEEIELVNKSGIEYFLLQSDNPVDLQNEVNEFLARGCRLYKNPSVAIYQHSSVFIQAMIKEE